MHLQPNGVLQFDCCNTVFNIDGVPVEELSDYIAQVHRPEWAPLTLPDHWFNLPAHDDAREGIARLISKGFRCVTCSNWPQDLLATLSAKAGIRWSAIIPMETVEAYKPAEVAYLNAARVCGVDPSQVLMVTANESAPDIETARSLGMQAILIDRERKYQDGPHTITELAEMLGC
jgi:2-haloalkanoic acid dehalogenase type II